MTLGSGWAQRAAENVEEEEEYLRSLPAENERQRLAIAALQRQVATLTQSLKAAEAVDALVHSRSALAVVLAEAGFASAEYDGGDLMPWADRIAAAIDQAVKDGEK